MTNKSKINDKNKQNKKLSEQWKFYSNSYAGGSKYRDGKYLYAHENETNASFERRKKMACYVNFCAPIVDIFNSYLFRERPVRDFGNMPQRVVDALSKNADNDGRSYAKLIREINRRASVYGFMGVIVDKPQSSGEANLKQEIDNGMSPYISVYRPEKIINWSRTKSGGRARLTMLVLEEDSLSDDYGEYRVWYEDRWELWREDETKKGDDRLKMVSSGINVLGEIPFVLVKNRDTFDYMGGISDLADIADINRNIYYYDSDAMEIVERTAFPFLEVPVDKLGSVGDGDVVVGTGNMLERDITDPTGHRWLEPTHNSLVRILEWRNQAVVDIMAIAKMGSSNSVSGSSTKVESGSALEVRFQQLNSILSDKAENMELAEDSILSFAASWEGVKWDGFVKYPRKFGVRDLITDLDNAIRARKSISSVKFNIALQKDLASRFISDFSSMDSKKRNEIMKDIEATVPTEPMRVRPKSQDLSRGPATPEINKSTPGRNIQDHGSAAAL